MSRKLEGRVFFFYFTDHCLNSTRPRFVFDSGMYYRCLPRIRDSDSLAFVRRRFGAEKKVANYDEALGVAGMRQIRARSAPDPRHTISRRRLVTSRSRVLSGLPRSYHRETTRAIFNSLGSRNESELQR